MTIEKKAKWIAGTLTALLLLATTTTIYYYGNSQSFKAEADQARLAQDSILAVKQLLDKEVFRMKAELDSAKGLNAELDKKLADSETALREKQTQIDKLVAENATVASLRKQLRDLKADRTTMEKQINDLLLENQQLQTENQQLTQNLAKLQSDNKILQDKLTAADEAHSKAGNFEVDMKHKGSKVTAKAKRTNEIGVSFDLPENLTDNSGNKDVYLVILDPQGKPVKNKSAKDVSLKDTRTISPVKTQSVDWSKNPQTVSMNVKLDSKLKQKGVYKVQVYTEDGMIGSSQLRMN